MSQVAPSPRPAITCISRLTPLGPWSSNPPRSGLGAGKGPYIAYHDGFRGASEFSGFLKGADRLVLDMHPYMAFDPSAYTET